MRRAHLRSWLVGVFGTAFAFAQSDPRTSLRFEVVSIKPTLGGRGGSSGPAPGGERYIATNTSLKSLIAQAYRLWLDQVIGGPDWMDRERFDIQAKAERPSSPQEFRAMLQNLLKEKFGLRFHFEQRQAQRHVLTIGAGGARLTESKSTEPSFDELPHERRFQVRWHATSVGTDDLVWRLAGIVNSPVVDHTGLKGAYDFDLTFIDDVPEEVRERAIQNGSPIDSHPTVFEALEKQLGLHLKPERSTVDVMVIDSAQRPPGN